MRSQNGIHIILLLLLAVMFVTLCVAHIETCTFAHDDLPYLPEYDNKVKGEGRWLNWILYPLFKYLNGHACLFVGIGCLAYFVYTCTKGISNRVTAVLAAVAACLIPSFNMLLDWPTTTLPALILLAVAAWSYNKISIAYYFAIFGILMGGVLQSPYMLLPFLFLRESNEKLLRIIGFWIGGYILGYLVSQVATYAMFGQFIQLAAWRKPHYITNTTALIENICRTSTNLNKHVRVHGYWLYVLLAIAAIGVVWNNRRDYKRGITLLILFTCTLFANYAQAVPAGIIVSLRTVLSFHIGILILILVSFKNFKLLKNLLLVLLGGAYFISSIEYLNYHNFCKQRWVDDFKKLNVGPHDVNGVAMLSSGDDFARAEKQYRQSGRIIPKEFSAGGFVQWRCAPYSLGFKYVYNPATQQKIIRDCGIKLDDASFKTVGALQYCIKKRVLFVRYVNKQ